jgi:hypothetical protein
MSIAMMASEEWANGVTVFVFVSVSTSGRQAAPGRAGGRAGD